VCGSQRIKKTWAGSRALKKTYGKLMLYVCITSTTSGGVIVAIRTENKNYLLGMKILAERQRIKKGGYMDIKDPAFQKSIEDAEFKGGGSKRVFETGATRDANDDKLQYEGFDNPLVTKRFAQYMHKNRHMKDGTMRDPDNWQNLFGEKHFQVCIESLTRHVEDLKLHHRGYSDEAVEELEDSICGILFNAKAYLLKILLEKRKNEKSIS
jgi:hypothetical protein